MIKVISCNKKLDGSAKDKKKFTNMYLVQNVYQIYIF